MSKHAIIQRMLDPGIVAVIRADSSEQLIDVCQALADGGCLAMEITMTTPNALQAIEACTNKLGDQILMGVGSVLDSETARLSFLAGAQFVVTPVMKPSVIRTCNRYRKPIVCGAYTPTEALTAHEEGADFVKIFPADGLGPDYIKAIRAPMPQLDIIPTGGVTPETCGAFIKAGCAAVAAGGSLVSKDLIQRKAWKELSALASRFVENIRAARN